MLHKLPLCARTRLQQKCNLSEDTPEKVRAVAAIAFELTPLNTAGVFAAGTSHDHRQDGSFRQSCRSSTYSSVSSPTSADAIPPCEHN